MFNRAIIIGSGASVRQNYWNIPVTDLSLWDKLKDEFTIGMNWSYNYYNSTVLMYSDYQWYVSHKDNLTDVPLILGKEDGYYSRKGSVKAGDNVVLLKECETKKKIKWNELSEGTHPHYWGKEAWTKGWYCSQLIGMKALNLAIALGCDEIFLLGFDACDVNGHTHFYADENSGSYVWDKQKYCGVGKNEKGLYNTGNYNKINELNEHFFKPFQEELKNGIEIYNVSPSSKINTFPKISYNEFYNKLNDRTIIVNHEIIREEIKKRLKITG